MASEWHYRKGDKQHGPVSASVLKSLAASGNLLPSDMVKKADSEDWKPASSVRGLCAPHTTASEATPSSKRSASVSGAATSLNTTPNKSSGPPPLPTATPSRGKPAPRKILLGAGSLVALVALCCGWFIWNSNSKENVRHSANAQSSELPSNESRNIDNSIPNNEESRSIAATSGARKAKSPVVEVNRSPEQMKAIAEIAKLKGSMFVDPTKSTKPVVKVVFKSKEFRGPDLIVLSQLPTIEELDIANTSVTDLNHLTSMPNLSVLHTPRLLPEQFKILAKLPKLTTLWCSVKNPVQREMARGYLTEALTNLTSAPALRHLRLDSCEDGASDVQVGMGSYSPLPKFTRLTYLHVGDTLFDRDIALVSKCNELEYIVLGWNAYIIRGRSTAAAREARRSKADFGSRSVSEVTSALGVRQLASCGKLKSLVFDGSIDDSIFQAAATLPACPELVYAGNSGLSDSTVIEVKNSKPEFQFRVGQSTAFWNTVAGNPQLVNINDLPKSTPRLQRQGASSDWSGVAEPMDMEERYKSLVNRVKPGMSKEQVEAILGMADESDEKDMGELNPQKAGQMLDICTWHGDTESQSSIILSFVNGRLQDGGTPGYDIRKGFSSQLPANLTPEERAKARKAAKGLGIDTEDE